METLKKNWAAIAAVVIVALLIYLYIKQKSVTAFQQYSTGPSSAEVTAALQAQSAVATAQISAESANIAALSSAISQRDVATVNAGRDIATTNAIVGGQTAIAQANANAAVAIENAKNAGAQSHDIFGLIGHFFGF
jgi:hypothetical protein